MFDFSNPLMSASAHASATSPPSIFDASQTGMIVDPPEPEEDESQFKKSFDALWRYFNQPTAKSVGREAGGVEGGGLQPNTNRYFEDDFPWLADAIESGGDKLNQLVEKVTASEVAGSDVSPAVFDYINADLAKAYGMDKSTAYQEALSNTAYQRAIKDMKAAGLNPAVLFGSGRGSGASGVSYVSRSGSGAGSKSDHLFDEGLYQALSVIGGLIGMKFIGGPNGFFIGSSATRAGMSLLDSISK